MLLLISNAVQNAMLGPDTSLLGGIIAVAVLLTMSVILGQLRLRSQRLRHLMQGTPTLLVLHGEIIPSHMRRKGLAQGARSRGGPARHGVAEVKDIEMVVLEVDGSISVVPVGQETRPRATPDKVRFDTRRMQVVVWIQHSAFPIHSNQILPFAVSYWRCAAFSIIIAQRSIYGSGLIR